MTSTYIQEQRSCLRAIGIPDRAYGVPAYDAEVPNALSIPFWPVLGSFNAEWRPVRELIGSRYESSGPEAVATIGRVIEGSVAFKPTPVNIKIAQNWAATLFDRISTMPWADEAPSSRQPNTDGEVASWTFDYIELPSAGQAERYYGVVFTSGSISGSLSDGALQIELGFTARNRSRDFFTYPADIAFTHQDVEGTPFLLKNSRIYVGSTYLEADSFRVSVENPCVFDYFGEDGLARRYGMDSQSVTVEVTFLVTEENRDTIDAWFTTSDYETAFRAQFVHPNSIRYQITPALPAGTGFIRMPPEQLASPFTPKSRFDLFRDQMIVYLEGAELGSPLNRISEVIKIDGTSVESPSGLWFSRQPTEANTRHDGLRQSFAAGAYAYSIGHEVVVPRCVPSNIRRFADGSGRIRKVSVTFDGLSRPL